MRLGFYPHLATDSIRKNKKLYFPYALTCICLSAMLYIISFLANSREMLSNMAGGSSAEAVLQLGIFVIVVFSLIFVFYTNSFLVRRRKKEFGLYNILGMGKKNISVIFFWETVIVFFISIFGGLLSGILLSKLFELILLKIMIGTITYSFYVSIPAIIITSISFCGIFLIVLISNLIVIYRTKPADLLKSENIGEKPPKSNWIFGALGVIILAGAYFIAVSIKEPLSALAWFFVAVIMVIVATYLIFIAGSVTVCRILQKNKGYYYNKRHFVSVSSMVYRMKRNGAGLASICILATMVLVMLSSTTCLYFGNDDAVRTRYPRNLIVDVSFETPEKASDENISILRDLFLHVAEEYGSETNNFLEYKTATITGRIIDGYLDPDPTNLNSFSIKTFDNIAAIFIIPLSDYNRQLGLSETLKDDEVLLYAERTTYKYDFIGFNGIDKTFTIKKQLTSFIGNGNAAMNIVPSLYVVVPDFDEAANMLMTYIGSNDEPMVRIHWYCGYDSDKDDATQINMYKDSRKVLRDLRISGAESGDEIFQYYTLENAANERADFLGTYGSLFFLGIVLSIVFILAAVLIIYYKQISEGYEDSGRFEIMQKVGMTKKDIKSSINSQLLTVFYLPLLFAALHLCFAFPIIYRILMIFNIVNLKLLIFTNVISFIIFAVFYAVVYKITSNSYYTIVSGAEQNG